MTSVTIGNSVTSIDSGAFNGCHSLNSVAISNSVTTIAGGVFVGCSSLTDVYYSGSKAQWNQIAIDNVENANRPLLNATIHFNS